MFHKCVKMEPRKYALGSTSPDHLVHANQFEADIFANTWPAHKSAHGNGVSCTFSLFSSERSKCPPSSSFYLRIFILNHFLCSH